jgi:hypothetical protein
VVLLKGAGFSLDEIYNMTMSQTLEFSRSIIKAAEQDFKRQIKVVFFGSQDAETVKRITQE